MRGKQWNRGGHLSGCVDFSCPQGKIEYVPLLQTQQRDESPGTGRHPADLFDLDGTKLIATLKLIPLPVVVHQQNGFEIPIGGGFAKIIEER